MIFKRIFLLCLISCFTLGMNASELSIERDYDRRDLVEEVLNSRCEQIYGYQGRVKPIAAIVEDYLKPASLNIPAETDVTAPEIPDAPKAKTHAYETMQDKINVLLDELDDFIDCSQSFTWLTLSKINKFKLMSQVAEYQRNLDDYFNYSGTVSTDCLEDTLIARYHHEHALFPVYFLKVCELVNGELIELAQGAKKIVNAKPDLSGQICFGTGPTPWNQFLNYQHFCIVSLLDGSCKEFVKKAARSINPRNLEFHQKAVASAYNEYRRAVERLSDTTVQKIKEGNYEAVKPFIILMKKMERIHNLLVDSGLLNRPDLPKKLDYTKYCEQFSSDPKYKAYVEAKELAKFEKKLEKEFSSTDEKKS